MKKGGASPPGGGLGLAHYSHQFRERAATRGPSTGVGIRGKRGCPRTKIYRALLHSRKARGWADTGASIRRSPGFDKFHPHVRAEASGGDLGLSSFKKNPPQSLENLKQLIKSERHNGGRPRRAGFIRPWINPAIHRARKNGTLLALTPGMQR